MCLDLASTVIVKSISTMETCLMSLKHPLTLSVFTQGNLSLWINTWCDGHLSIYFAALLIHNSSHYRDRWCKWQIIYCKQYIPPERLKKQGVTIIA